MRYLLLIYTDESLLQALPDGEADAMMRHCFASADAMKTEGTLLQSQQLEAAAGARSVRIRDGQVSVSDGPFAETRELLGGFNLIEADSLEQAVEIASRFPWARTGCVEVRAIRDMAAVRRQVGSPPAP